MKQITEKRKLLYYYITAFIIPMVMMLAVYIILGTHPFGERSILIADLRYQFVDYYNYFKTIILGDNDFFYTFSKSLGGDAIGFCAYYLQNPLNLILLFFSRENITTGILILVVLEAGIAGLCFNFYLNQMYKPHISSIIFSTAYAFIGLFVSYANCTMYFLNIAILPLVMLGIHRIVKDPKRKSLFIFSFAGSIIVCYYMGYMVGLFSILYFIYDLSVEMKTIKRFREYREQILSFAISGLLAVGLSAFVLIPTVLSLFGEKGVDDASELILSRKFYMKDLFSNLYTMSFDGNISDGRPVIYAGLLAVVFTFVCLLHRRITKHERVISLIFILVMLGTFYIYAVDLLWHGLTEPVGFPYRDSFLFSFLLLHFAYRGFTTAREYGIDRKIYVIILGIFFVYSGYLMLTKLTMAGQPKTLLINLVLFLLMIAAAYGYTHKIKMTGLFLCMIFLLQCTDSMMNAVYSISLFPTCTEEEYLKDVAYAKEGIEAIQEYDHSFYRMEKNFRRSHNDAMAYNFNGLSHFSSTQKRSTKEFLGKMGFRNNGNWAFYNDGSTTFADCFLGVKYLLSQFDAHGKPYPIIMSGDRYWVFKNPYALPIGFGITKDIFEVNMQNEDLFKIQNDIADSFASKHNHIYEEIEVKNINIVNLSQEGTTYQKIDPDQDSYIEYELSIDRNQLVYLYFGAPSKQEADLIINEWDNRGQYFSTYNWDMVDIGGYEPGETVSVRLKLTGDTITVDQALFYYENEESLMNWYQQSQINGWSPEKLSSSHLKGEITTTEEYPYLMFSIPYEPDWQIFIDEQKVETIKTLDALLSVKIEPGTHLVELIYIPRGLYFGVIITILSTFGIIVLNVSKTLKNQQKRR